MSAEPEHSIDAKLRDYARKRRAAVDLPGTIHGASRGLLQSEVRKVYGPGAAPASPRSWWFRWPGLATLGGAVAILCVGLVVFSEVPSSKPDSGNGNVYAVADAMPLSELPKLSQQGETRSADFKLRLRESAAKASEPLKEGTLAPSAPAPTLTVASAGTAVASESLRRELAPPSAVSLQSPNRTQLFFANADSPSDARLSLVRSDRDKGKAGGATTAVGTVLREFELSYSDQTALIRDADGSIYGGAISPITSSEADVGALKKSQGPKQVEEVQGAGMNSPVVIAGRYRVDLVGTNRSLNQRVVLQGQLINRQAPALDLSANSIQKPASPAAQRTQAASQLGSTWEFQSSVSLGTQQPVQFNAFQVASNRLSTPPPP